jgi:hypothetical protein
MGEEGRGGYGDLGGELGGLWVVCRGFGCIFMTR